MNKWYIYLTCDYKKEGIHVGFCRDIIKLIEFYKSLPTLFFSPKRQNILVHIEIAETENDAVERFREISGMDVGQKAELITLQNESWIELVPNIHFDA